MIEKSEAQLKQEEEVRRIKEERGWDTEEYQKAQKRFDIVSRIPKFIVIFGVIAVIGVGIIMREQIAGFIGSLVETNKTDDSRDAKQEDLVSDATSSDEEEGSEQEPGTLEATTTQNNGDEVRVEYQRRIEEINAEHEQRIAEIDAEHEANIERINAEKATNDKKIQEQQAQQEKEKNCDYEYKTWATLDQEAEQAFAVAEADNKIYESDLHDKCDNSPDPQACAISLHTEYTLKIGRAQELIAQAKAARQTYESCLRR